MRPILALIGLIITAALGAPVFAIPVVSRNLDLQASIATMQVRATSQRPPIYSKFLGHISQLKRSSSTCADPSLARKFYQGYSTALTTHDMDTHAAFVHADTSQGPGSTILWSLQGAAFMGWPTQQPFTVPLFRMASSTVQDFIFMIGPDAQTPPIVPGFSAKVGSILAWVYDTPVCGSVPLMSLVLAAETDHYYTVDTDEHAELITRGWADSGIVAYVLPLSN